MLLLSPFCLSFRLGLVVLSVVSSPGRAACQDRSRVLPGDVPLAHSRRVRRAKLERICTNLTAKGT